MGAISCAGFCHPVPDAYQVPFLAVSDVLAPGFTSGLADLDYAAKAIGLLLPAGVFDDVVALISVPGFDFTKVPKKSFKFAEFMHRIGALKSKPESWKDLYFPEAHGLPGD